MSLLRRLINRLFGVGRKPDANKGITPELAPELAQRFVDFTKSIEGIELDYSIDSLERVDEVIEKMRREGHTVNDLDRVLLVAGCYIGEIITRRHKLRWVKAEESSYAELPGSAPIVIEYAAGNYTSPIDKVMKRLENGKEDYLPFYYQVLCKLMKETET